MYSNKTNRFLSDIKNREVKNGNFLHLTINENQLSDTARSFLSSKLSERYFFGGGQDGIIDFGSFTFVGMPEVEALVDSATLALKKMTGAKVVNLNCFSGLHAMMCTILTTTNPGDTILSIKPEDGGHSATKGVIEKVGRKHQYASFDLEKLAFNVKETNKTFKSTNAKALYIDISVYLNKINLKELRAELGNEAVIIFDASHNLGLVLGQEFQQPFVDGADIICANTHKTFAGPQRGIIMFKDEDLGNEANMTIQTTFVSSVHIHHLIALCIAILEYEAFGTEYAKQVIKNSRVLATELHNKGYEIRHSNTENYSNNEQVHLFVDQIGDRVKLYKNLVNNNISTNFMTVLGGRAFARIGTQEITRRGMKTHEMKNVADLFDRALKGENVKNEVIKFNSKFPTIYYSFDNNK